nr:MAG TPA: hypothetical protein [Caudoviricetes sp.]
MIYWGKRALTLGPRWIVALAALIITHLYVVSSGQRLLTAKNVKNRRKVFL